MYLVEIRVRDLRHDYDNRRVFKSISFSFDRGTLAVTGPNGSGKSTLLRILAGLLTPTSGHSELVVDGAVVSRDHLRYVAGLAAPDLPLYPELSVKENLLLLSAIRFGKANPAGAEKALSALRLHDRADDPFGELSSGLRRRACIAAAIQHQPAVLFLDEPHSNLDEVGIEAVDNVIKAQVEEGLVIIATNDPERAKAATAAVDLGALH